MKERRERKGRKLLQKKGLRGREMQVPWLQQRQWSREIAAGAGAAAGVAADAQWTGCIDGRWRLLGV